MENEIRRLLNRNHRARCMWTILNSGGEWSKRGEQRIQRRLLGGYSSCFVSCFVFRGERERTSYFISIYFKCPQNIIIATKRAWLKARNGAHKDWHLIGILWIREQYGTLDAHGFRSYILRWNRKVNFKGPNEHEKQCFGSNTIIGTRCWMLVDMTRGKD
jgi:hypothetical protein